MGVAVDAAGDLFIADYVNNRDPRGEPATGVITTVAGNGTRVTAATVARPPPPNSTIPRAWRWTPRGDLFIADTDDHAIREVNVASGAITTVAGNGPCIIGDGGPATAPDWLSPAGVAVDNSGAPVHRRYLTTSRFAKWTLPRGMITIVAGEATGFSATAMGPATAELRTPYNVAVDAAGHLLIGDCDNSRGPRSESFHGGDHDRGRRSLRL